MNNTIFTCCIGDCKHILKMDTHLVTNHIKKYHPQAVKQLNLTGNAYYCILCDTYDNHKHYHCKSCDLKFNMYEDVLSHYKLYHVKWWLAPDCANNQDCKKIKCKYNHYYYEKNYIIEHYDIIPDSICEYDLPWINIRCSDNNCNKDHFHKKYK